jgi:hypothetical protein
MHEAKTVGTSRAKTSCLDQQERDAEAGQQGIPGEAFRPWGTIGSVHSQTNSNSLT